MNAEVEKMIRKARRSLAAAQRLFESEDYDFAASRAYYAMFYLAEALLFTKGLAFSKHSAVIAAFGEHFARTGLLPGELHRALRDAFEQRQRGDYQFEEAYPRENAEMVLDNAKRFLQEVEMFVSTAGTGPAVANQTT